MVLNKYHTIAQTVLTLIYLWFKLSFLFVYTNSWTLNRSIGWAWDIGMITNFFNFIFFGCFILAFLMMLLWLVFYKRITIRKHLIWAIHLCSIISIIGCFFYPIFELLAHFILFGITLFLLFKIPYQLLTKAKT